MLSYLNPNFKKNYTDPETSIRVAIVPDLPVDRAATGKTLPGRLIRECVIFKANSDFDFVVATSQNAMAVIDGNVWAINPIKDRKMQMFICMENVNVEDLYTLSTVMINYHSFRVVAESIILGILKLKR